MNINEKQNSAKQWSKGLKKLNESQNGQIPIVFKDNDGKKSTGYIHLTDISLLVGGKEITLGALLTEMLNFNVETLNKVVTISKGVASVGNDLLIIKENELGFIDTITQFNNKIDLVIANQQIPVDYNKGYYYVKDGIIVFDENRKLELYPDFV